MLVREIDLHTVTLSSVALSYDRRMLFSGAVNGDVQAFAFPLTLPGSWEDFKLHGDLVTRMRLSRDNQRLVTAGRDGSLCIWQVRHEPLGMSVSPQQQATIGLVSEAEVEYAQEILITKAELEDKNRLVLSLQQQVRSKAESLS